ncbi:MKRN2 opposite strand protein [Osmia bicornis bicornis]|uniref:MKRN2 opposite strand protein n=1 Tax=Osmia bicornis bicornis TaxID=1437191 RepID=UPI0010F437D6|nr:MKRN2 opposite strand protein [Osmia bicornis bicornis]XP_029038612.1 MKRN2 opposite strand protein [Osmia bicornis bicornis]
MACDPRIICFQHCCPKNIFCKNVPETCPICQMYITKYIVDPFVVPYPYINAAHQSTSIVVRPSQGNFLNDYHIANDLHIGITNSEGIVFEYDKEGIIINDWSKWINCIALTIVPSCWEDHWNETLKIMLKDSKWKSENYDENSMNCFNFVLEFIYNLQYMDMKFISKECMCNKLILPKIQEAIKYNSLFKKLQINKCFVL